MNRLLQLKESQGFLFFGARGVGRKYLLENNLNHDECLWLDLSDEQQKKLYTKKPSEFISLLRSQANKIKYIIINDIIKIPNLFKIVQQHITNSDKSFILTSNTTQGLNPAVIDNSDFVVKLHPMTYKEIGDKFDLLKVLRFGSLPELICNDYDDYTKLKYIQDYINNFIYIDIVENQLVRKVSHFKKFVELVAIENGMVVNQAKIARKIGVDDKTINLFFNIIVDNMVGFWLPPISVDFRHTLTNRKKFFYFDLGIANAFANNNFDELIIGSPLFIESFKAYLTLEIVRLCSYLHHDYKCHFLNTKDGLSIDLVITRPKQRDLFIMLSPRSRKSEIRYAHAAKFVAEYENGEFIVLSRIAKEFEYLNGTVYPWQSGLDYIFNL